MDLILKLLPTVWSTRSFLYEYSVLGFKEEFLNECNLEAQDSSFHSNFSENLYLRLYDQYQHYHEFRLSRAVSMLKDPIFRADFNTVIFCHGYMDSPQGFLGFNIMKGYRERGDHNIVMLDSSRPFSSNYFYSARATYHIGVLLGALLVELSKSGLNMKKLTVIGHSLGAQTAGFTGKTYFNMTREKLSNIVGLDPAGPCFRNLNDRSRISSDDAEFLQVIHTDVKNLGLTKSLGHVDFYINSGKRQPANKGSCRSYCSHIKAVAIWSAAVQFNKSFVGIQCNSFEEAIEGKCLGSDRKTAIMGPEANPKVRGIFNIVTSSIFPYFLKNSSQQE